MKTVKQDKFHSSTQFSVSTVDEEKMAPLMKPDLLALLGFDEK